MNVKTPLALLLAMLLCVAASILNAADEPAPKPQPLTADEIGAQVLKQVEFKGTHLSTAIQYLRTECPGFQAVVLSDADCTDPDPILPDMSLKNVAADQVLDVIQRACRGLEVAKNDSGPSLSLPVWMFRLGGPEGSAAPTVNVFRLKHLIVGDTPAARAETLKDILSLIEAAHEATGSKESLKMRLHEATATLIFKGSPAQIEVVNRALKALESAPSEVEHSRQLAEAEIERNEHKAEITQLKKSLLRAEDEAAYLRKGLNEQIEQNEHIKARLHVTDVK